MTVSTADLPLLPTALVGSYPQPGWLVDREVLLGSKPPRVRMEQVWRFDGALRTESQDDAVRLALRDFEAAGIDIVTDGEIRRESYFNHFANALDGIDIDNPGYVQSRAGTPSPVPRVVGPVRRTRPVEVEAARFLRANTGRRVKITVPGPFTMTQLAVDEHYGDVEALAMAYADAVNAELKDLKAAGADVVQIDEPYLQAKPDLARSFGIAAINRALAGVTGPTVVHMCFGYAYVVKDKPSGYSFLPELAGCDASHISIEAAQPKLDLAVLERLPGKSILVGVLDLGDDAVETAETVAGRLRAALKVLPAERIVAAPDCGMKYLPRAAAFGKLKALAEGAAIVRRELTGNG
ncbi:5-methyltetrahydropteroyltriglutamate--homocysteine methyltransferase [Marinibaculum pumilum]|uniref:5-methyltetrahydropteroyltriglutamate--homocysteine methyltransferase n=1 Tax=Marinibaculum pumilum TaxID=1766165 RepID=A0ABV7L2K4_9PROT